MPLIDWPPSPSTSLFVVGLSILPKLQVVGAIFLFSRALSSRPPNMSVHSISVYFLDLSMLAISTCPKLICPCFESPTRPIFPCSQCPSTCSLSSCQNLILPTLSLSPCLKPRLIAFVQTSGRPLQSTNLAMIMIIGPERFETVIFANQRIFNIIAIFLDFLEGFHKDHV